MPYTRYVSVSIIFVFALFMVSVLTVSQAIGAEKTYNAEIFHSSGYPLPRFVSFLSDEANVRTGPGKKYPIKWVVKQEGLPVEVIREFEHWRLIKDHEGEEGWVFKTLLSGKRMALIHSDFHVKAYATEDYKDQEKPNVSMMLEPLCLVEVRSCKEDMCQIFASDLLGWIERKSLWGVYADENFD